MQVNLSNLVDLALGKPHDMECENFNMLHALLQVMLKKLNMSNTQIELTDELADKAKNLMKRIPNEPSICFREFTLKAGGGKIRKRNSREIAIKRSLTQVTKRWPHCCPVETVLNNSVCSSLPSLVSPVLSEKESLMDVNENVSRLTEKIEILFGDIGQRIGQLEKQFQEFLVQAECKNEQYCAALDDLKNLKGKFEKASPALEQLQASKERVSVDGLSGNGSSHANDPERSVEQNSKRSTATSTSTEDEGEEDSLLLEVKWLKERMLDMSESLKMHSRCLKRLKCEEFEKMKKDVEVVSDMLLGVKCEVIDSKNKISLVENKKDDGEFRRRIAEVEKKIEFVQTDLECRLMTMKKEFLGETKAPLASQTSMSSGDSELINSQNLQQRDSNGKCLNTQEYCAPVGKFCFMQNCCPINAQSQSLLCCTVAQIPQCDSIKPLNHLHPSQANEASYPCENQVKESAGIEESLHNLQCQITAHRSCLHQLTGDLAMKMDRCEFEMCRRQLSETIDLVMKLRHDQACPPTAAGGTTPLLRKINCLSCGWGPTNMRTYDSPVPLAPKMRTDRARNGSRCCSIRSQCRNISQTNWACYNAMSGRRVSESYTKIGKAMEIRQIRCKRLKTPVKIVSSRFVCKHRFQRSHATNCL